MCARSSTACRRGRRVRRSLRHRHTAPAGKPCCYRKKKTSGRHTAMKAEILIGAFDQLALGQADFFDLGVDIRFIAI